MTSAADWKRVQALFHQALEQPPERREDWIESACCSAAESDELRSLLESHADAESGAFDRRQNPLRGVQAWPASTPLAAGTRVGPFEVLGILGVGGMGTVYRASQARPQREVALKMLDAAVHDDRRRQRFESEAEILAHLAHPGIAQVYGAGTFVHEGISRPWFAMEFIDGGRSLTRFAREEALELNERVRLGVQVCAAVQYGHMKGIVHRDLKPANLPVGRDGRCRVIDFGVAKITDADLVGPREGTLAGQLIGTPGYMSPEQAAGDVAHIDVRTDVYALGVVFYELFTDRSPYPSQELPLLAALKVVQEQPADRGPLATLPRDLAAVLDKALHKQPAERYQACSDLAADLQRTLDGRPVSARRASRLERLRGFVRQNRALSAASLALLVSLFAGALGTTWALFQERERAREAVAALGEARWSRNFLAGLLQDADPYRGEGPGQSLEELVLHARERLAQDPPPAGAEADVRVTLGGVLHNLGNLEGAADELTLALDYFVANGDEMRALPVHAELGYVLLGLERVKEAEQQARLGEALGQRIEGPLGKETLRLRLLGGRVLAATGKRAEAQEFYGRELARVSSALGSEHPWSLTLRSNVATEAAADFDLARARAEFEHCVAGRESALGPDHPDTLSARAGLASTLGLDGELEEAVRQLEKVVAGRSRVLGPTHPSTLTSENDLAVMLRQLGQPQEAAQRLRHVVDGLRERLGSGHERTLKAISNLCAAIVAQARQSSDPVAIEADLIEVGELYDEYLNVTLEPPATGPSAVVVRSALAELTLLTGQLDQAEVLYEQTFECADAVWPADAWQRALLEASRARYLAATGQVQQAREVLESSLRVVAAARGDEHPYCVALREQLGGLGIGD